MYKYLFFVVFISIILYSCSEVVEVEDHPQETDGVLYIPVTPDSIIQKANDFVISSVGEEFFNAYIKYEYSRYHLPDSFCIKNPSSCLDYLQNPYYQFVYRFKIPEKEYIDEIIEFLTDSLGNVISQQQPYGIPECTGNECWNNFFTISRDSAVLIAKDNDFEEGLREWEISFHYYGADYNNYVWTVSNTLIQSERNFSGRTLVIKAEDGEILNDGYWVAIP